jgi:hypothetical protein
MKVSKSKLDAIEVPSTKTKFCLSKTLASSGIGMDEDIFLKSLIITFEIGSDIVTFLFANFVIIEEEVTIPTIFMATGSYTGY